jgi:predicted nucleotidyltransferase
MTRDEIIARIRARADDIRALGASGVFLFGSAARDELRDDSDIDVFIDREPGAKFTFVELTDLQFLLEDEFGREIDLTTRGGLHPRLREKIEASAIQVL